MECRWLHDSGVVADVCCAEGKADGEQDAMEDEEGMRGRCAFT